MKFIKDVDGDLINMEVVEYIFLNDKGNDYPERFEIIVCSHEVEYILRRYRSEKAANGFLRRLHENHKFEMGKQD